MMQNPQINKKKIKEFTQGLYQKLSSSQREQVEKRMGIKN